MAEVAIVGGGVIGLALARALAASGRKVVVLDAERPGSSSWAAAGIIPPALPDPRDPLARLFAESVDEYPRWTEALREESGVDPEFHRCGAVYLADSPCGASELDVLIEGLGAQGVACVARTAREIAELEPGVNPRALRALTAGWEVPEEAQIRSPRLLAALRGACAARGVERVAVDVAAIDRRGARVIAVVTKDGRPFAADSFCFTAGAWSEELLAEFGVAMPVAPVRGQILLLRGSVVRRIVNQGPHYLVPRSDGQILVGSTVEHVGFDRSTTDAAIDVLRRFAEELFPALRGAEEIQRWAGLRPGTPDGRPLLGRLPECDNAFVAAGHFRGGLILAPVTARLMSEWIGGREPEPPLDALRPDRFQNSPHR